MCLDGSSMFTAPSFELLGGSGEGNTSMAETKPIVVDPIDVPALPVVSVSPIVPVIPAIPLVVSIVPAIPLVEDDEPLEDITMMGPICEEELDDLFKSLEILEQSDIVEPVKKVKVKQEKASAATSVATTAEWLAPDEQFKKLVAEGGHNASAAQNSWALRRLHKFREHIGDDLSVDFLDMAAHRQADLLCRFFEQVTKKNGELYPTQTTMQLLDSFNRIMRRHQEARILRTAVEELPFHIKSAPMFKRVGVVVVAAMRRARDAGANKKRKKSPTMSCKDEAKILKGNCMQIGHSRGLQKRILYFMTFRFGVRGGKELYKVMVADITVGRDGRGRFVRYDERLSKNYKVDMSNFQEEHFREPVTSYDEDMVETFTEYLRHLPPSAIYLFCSAIDNPSGVQWYYSTRMGLKPLLNFTQWIFEQMGLDVKEFTNKSGRTTLITRMSQRGVPDSVGMLLSGHKTESAYKRYDRTTDVKVRAAHRCAGTEEITYEAALKEEMEFMVKNEINGADVKEEPMEDGSPEKKSRIEASISQVGSSVDSGENTTSQTELPVKGKSFLKKVVATASEEDYELIENFDWEEDFNLWKESRNVVLNPITAMMGKLSGCTVSITFNGSVNMCNK